MVLPDEIFTFAISIICPSPQKSSAARKVYRADRLASGFRSWAGPSLSNLSVIAARCHLPYRGEALAYRKVSPFPGNLPSSPEAPLLGELSPKVTERLYEGQPDRETQKSPLGVHGSLGAFHLVSSMEHSRNSIFSICDSPQKSSAARKVYRAARQTSPQCARLCSFSSKSVLYWSCGSPRNPLREGVKQWTILLHF